MATFLDPTHHQQQPAGAPQQPPQALPPTDRELVAFSTKAAEVFVSAYYAATDSPNRARLLPLLYSPTASIVWNGNPVSAKEGDASNGTLSTGAAAAPVEQGGGGGGLAALLAGMPGSKHEVATFDAHPVGWGVGADGIPSLRSILVTVSGLVQHHTPAAALPTPNEPNSAAGSTAGASPLAMMALPRAFSQCFVLIDGAGAAGEEMGGVRVVEERGRVQGPASGGGGGGGSGGSGTAPALRRTARWFIQSDSFRFVG